MPPLSTGACEKGEINAMFNVIFDMDGVIFDSERTLLECWIETAGNYNMDEELVRSTYIKCIGTNSRQTTEIFTNAFGDILSEEMLKNIWDESVTLHRTRYPDGKLPVKAGVRDILEYLQSSGISVGIASSTRRQKVERQIKHAGLSDYFVGIIGGDAVTISKPNPEIYLLACREFGFEPGSTFAVEDSFNGIRAANAAGMRPIMVPDIVPADAEMHRLSEFVCKDLLEAMDYLKKV